MNSKLHCSFCGKSEDDIAKLAAGPGGVHICDECVALCQVIMHGDGPAAPRAFDPATWPEDRLVALLAPVNATVEAHRAHLQAIVDGRRARGVSWAIIGAQLGISRQSAWERFT